MRTEIYPIFQMARSWHDGGMFIGMHWAWWSVWVITLLILGWAFWRIFADRSETHRQAHRQELAEQELRQRFARGEIDENEFENRLRALREARFTG